MSNSTDSDLSDKFDRDLKKLVGFNVYACFLVSLGAYGYATLDSAAKLDAEKLTGTAFADTNMVVLGGGTIFILGRAAVRGVQRLINKHPQP